MIAMLACFLSFANQYVLSKAVEHIYLVTYDQHSTSQNKVCMCSMASGEIEDSAAVAVP